MLLIETAKINFKFDNRDYICLQKEITHKLFIPCTCVRIQTQLVACAKCAMHTGAAREKGSKRFKKTR